MKGGQNMIEVDKVFIALADQLLFWPKGKEHHNMMYHSGDGVAGLVFSLRIQMDYFDYHPYDGNHKMGYGADSADYFVHILVYDQHRTFAAFNKHMKLEYIPLDDWKFLTTHDAQWRDSIKDYIEDSIMAAQASVLQNVPYKVREKFGDHTLTDFLLSFGTNNLFRWVRAEDEPDEDSKKLHARKLTMLRFFENRGDPENIMPPWDSNTAMSDSMIENQLEQLSNQLEGEDDEDKKRVLLDTIQDMQTIMEKRQQYRNELDYPRTQR